MIAANRPVQRPGDARLLAIGPDGALTVRPRESFPTLLRPGDVVVANDAATLPASLTGAHGRAPIEVRLAGRGSLDPDDLAFAAVVFGDGDFRTPTEERAPPPRLYPGDKLRLGPLDVRVSALLGHPRFVALAFDGRPDAVWAGIAAHGRPVQYAHLHDPLALWDVWTPIAGPPVAFEPPSAGFVLDWALLREIRAAGADFATLTHAAGLSSTGDAALDARLPLPEPYRIPEATVRALARAWSCGGRVIAIGTTVTRALEHAARSGALRAGDGVADQRIGPETALRVVDVILSGAHEPGASHYELLRAFAPDAALAAADARLEAEAFRTHEFGDSVLIERRAARARLAA